MHRAAPKKKPPSALEKRVPRNPKYASIQSRIDSGLTMDKVCQDSDHEDLSLSLFLYACHQRKLCGDPVRR